MSGCSFWSCVFGTWRQRDLIVNQDEAHNALSPGPRRRITITKTDIIDADEVAVGLTALQESLEPNDPALHSLPSRLFNAETSGASVDLASPYFHDLLSDTPV
ncbi:hypothetical protein GGX14DRAFT_406742 [Mycena pura]|uniref:Uncharacterized protein n=1 Tax=Mycena pura TaxID=153505 RepID=A0AAD6Y191_9AGAR|nr:hypothetical protein GGX14DRAFT_406742 [Mycena pura]